MKELNLVYVKVWSDGQQSVDEPTEEGRSDDFEIRKTTYCDKCQEEYHIHYKEPFASCGCGTTEWYY